MNQKFTRSQETVTPRHRTTPGRAVGRTKRAFGTTALVFAATTAVVLPMQAPASAAPSAHTATVRTVSTGTAATALAASTGSARTGLFTSGVTGSRYRQAVYELRLRIWVNRVRAARGIRPIVVRACDDGYAERWTGYLTRNNQFRHQDLGRYMAGCHRSGAGEILALGSVTPVQMVQMWMHSPEHRAIMLSRSYGLSGIAARRNANGNWIGCIDFGRR